VKVLLVEEEKNIRKCFCDILVYCFSGLVEILVAENIDEARKIFEVFPELQLILIDSNIMRDEPFLQNGEEYTGVLVALSANVDHDDHNKLYDDGCTHIVGKEKFFHFISRKQFMF
jgi:CheY-like chemotaxis protein